VREVVERDEERGLPEAGNLFREGECDHEIRCRAVYAGRPRRGWRRRVESEPPVAIWNSLLIVQMV
jgi:hypothetical protein